MYKTNKPCRVLPIHLENFRKFLLLFLENYGMLVAAFHRISCGDVMSSITGSAVYPPLECHPLFSAGQQNLLLACYFNM